MPARPAPYVRAGLLRRGQPSLSLYGRDPVGRQVKEGRELTQLTPFPGRAAVTGQAADPGGPRPLVVTISATYGAGGSLIAPMLAERLGVQWLDRLVSAEAAEQAGRPAAEGLSDREEAATPGSRLFLYLARAAGVNAMAPADTIVDHNEVLRTRAESEVRELCSSGGVLLGRAGAVVLARRPWTYHVRLDGPADRRAARAVVIDGTDLETARQHMADTDRARALYVRRLYRADASNPALYHLVLDPTVMATEHAVEVIVAAVRAFSSWASDQGEPG